MKWIRVVIWVLWRSDGTGVQDEQTKCAVSSKNAFSELHNKITCVMNQTTHNLCFRLFLACWLAVLPALFSPSALAVDGNSSHSVTAAIEHPLNDALTLQGLPDDDLSSSAFQNLLQGRFQQATDQYKQHLKQYSEDDFARYNFAVVLGNSGRVAEAITQLEMIGQGKPRDTLNLALKDQANLALSRLHLHQGDAKAAIQALKRISLEGVFAAEALTQLGHAYTRSRQAEPALKAWERLVVDFPTEAGAGWLRYGDMLSQQGNKSKAVDVYRDALSLYGQQRKAIANVLKTTEDKLLVNAVRGLPILLDELFADSAFIKTWREFSNRNYQQQTGSKDSLIENRGADKLSQNEHFRRMLKEKLTLHDDQLKVYMDQARFQLARIMDEALGQ